MADDLAAFVAARLDEDAAAAHLGERLAADRAAAISEEDLTETCERAARREQRYDDPWWAATVTALRQQVAWAPHDPARALREVAAKRAILALHKISTEPEILNIDHHDKKWNTGWTERKPSGHTIYWCETCDHDRDYGHIGGRDEGCETIRTLAVIWSGHPDYRQEWAPAPTTISP